MEAEGQGFQACLGYRDVPGHIGCMRMGLKELKLKKKAEKPFLEP